MTQVPTHTVLLVDDQPEILQWTHGLLAGHPSFEVVAQASSGEQAVELLRTLDPRPRVVIMDIQMPGMNGFEAAGQMLALDPDLRIILTSAAGNPQYEALARQTNVLGFLPKQTLSPDAVERLLRDAAPA